MNLAKVLPKSAAACHAAGGVAWTGVLKKKIDEYLMPVDEYLTFSGA